MKNLLVLFLLIASSAFAGPGDGTLPVIRNVQIDFIDAGAGGLFKLPECVRLNVNKKLAVGQSVTKELELQNANLKQKIILKNQQGELDINVNSNLLHNSHPVASFRRDLNQDEFLNELQLQSEKLVQIIQVNNFDQNVNCVNN